jgi:hypothetical protein
VQEGFVTDVTFLLLGQLLLELMGPNRFEAEAAD